MYKIEIPRQIGQAVKEKGLEKGLTQEELAKLSNTSRSLIYRREKELKAIQNIKALNAQMNSRGQKQNTLFKTPTLIAIQARPLNPHISYWQARP